MDHLQYGIGRILDAFGGDDGHTACQRRWLHHDILDADAVPNRKQDSVVTPHFAGGHSPSSSYCGHCLEKKALLSTTAPKRDWRSPASMARRRLSPSVNVNSSYQTSTWRSGEGLQGDARRSPYPQMRGR